LRDLDHIMIAVAQPGRVASQREVARRLGISHTALQKAQRSGRIAPEPDGYWDVEKVRAQLARTADPARRVVFVKGSQVGGTECGNTWIGYVVAREERDFSARRAAVRAAEVRLR
jgi:phage terminase large subunit GpA-like protein